MFGLRAESEFNMLKTLQSPIKQGAAYHKVYTKYRSGATSHMKHVTGHKANGDNISTTAALNPRLVQRQTKREHTLQDAGTALLKTGKVLTDKARQNLNINLC